MIKGDGMKKDFIDRIANKLSNEIRIAGGGSGINFTTNGNTNLDVIGKLFKSSNNLKVKVETADSFDAQGYMDGMSNVKMDILECKPPKVDTIVDALKKISLNENDMYDIVDESDKKFDDDEKDMILSNCKTLDDILDYIKEVKIEVYLSFKNYKKMIFGGYTRGRISKGDLIMDESDDYEGEILINGIAIDIYSEELKELSPVYLAGEDFVHFYNGIFYDAYSNIESNIRQTIKDNFDEYEDEYKDEEVDGVLFGELTEEDKVEYVFKRRSDSMLEGESEIYYEMMRQDYSA